MEFLKISCSRFFRASLLAVFLTVSGVFVVASSTLAQTPTQSCTCFCGDPDLGASSFGAYPDPIACAKDCRDPGLTYVGCYQSEEQFPENNTKCWTQNECTTWLTEVNGKQVPGAWGGVNSFCSTTKSGTKMGYCYGPLRPVKLNIPVLGQASVRSFGEYLGLAYTFLLPAMSTIAVVMIMVGGLEWLISGGSSKRIEKAKTRIKGAVIGLLLLMSAYTIVSLLDPRTVRFDALRVPAVKQVVILDSSGTCEALKDNGYSVNPNYDTCGKEGRISSIEGVGENVISRWKVGDMCKFSRCDTPNEICMSDGLCSACHNIPFPSASTCASAEYLADDSMKYYCAYDAGLNSCVTLVRDQISTLTQVSAYISTWFETDVTNVKTGFSCAGITSSAIENSVGCRVYGNTLELVAKDRISFLSATTDGKAMLKRVCESDPCGVAKVMGVTRCAYVDYGGENSGACDNVYPPGSEPQQPDTSGPGNFPTP